MCFPAAPAEDVTYTGDDARGNTVIRRLDKASGTTGHGKVAGEDSNRRDEIL